LGISDFSCGDVIMMEIFWVKVEREVSKESKNKKKLQNSKKQAPVSQSPAPRQELSAEEKARIIRDRLANRPVIMFRYPNGKWNLKLIVSLVIMFVTLIASLYFVSSTSRH
jgi:hypothetical protein